MQNVGFLTRLLISLKRDTHNYTELTQNTSKKFQIKSGLHMLKDFSKIKILTSQNELSVPIRANFCAIIFFFLLRFSILLLFLYLLIFSHADFDVQKCVQLKI